MPSGNSRHGIPPQWVRWDELQRWITECYRLDEKGTAGLLPQLVVELRREPDCFQREHFRLSLGNQPVRHTISSWNGLDVNWNNGTVEVSPLLNLGGSVVQLAVSWEAVVAAVTQVRIQQRREERHAARPGGIPDHVEEPAATAVPETGDRQPNAAAAADPEPAQHSLSIDPEYIDLNEESPRLPRYSIKGPHPRAGLEQIDDCIRKIAELHGGKTNRVMIRRWGRVWLRKFRNADTGQGSLEKRFGESEHDARRRSDGDPRKAG